MKAREEKEGSAGTGIYAGLVLLVVVVGGLIALVTQNTESATLRLLQFEWTAPLMAILLAAVLATVILDEAIGAVWRSRRRRIRAERNELEARRAQSAVGTGDVGEDAAEETAS